MAVLVLNCGSSSLKFAVVDPQTGERPLHGLAERLGTPEAVLHTKGATKTSTPIPSATHDQAVADVLAQLRTHGLQTDLAAVGHRVVHGGETFTDATLITEDVERTIASLTHLAPLHNPANLLGIRAAKAALPSLAQVAVFDTAFHQTMPPAAYRYAVPGEWYSEHGVRRYGFHGTSHRYVAQQAATVLNRPLTELNLLTAHLGNGCSATAIAAGNSVDTTMGLTPLGGLVMGTRCGDIDPGILGHIAARLDVDLDQVLTLLNKRSGLLGLSGTSNDMRALLEARAGGHEGAALAVEVFCHRLAASLMALCASLPSLDALVFTGGIGEHAAPIRAEVIDRLWPLQLRIDASRNTDPAAHHGRIDRETGPAVLVIPTDEERMIALDTQRVVQQ